MWYPKILIRCWDWLLLNGHLLYGSTPKSKLTPRTASAAGEAEGAADAEGLGAGPSRSSSLNKDICALEDFGFSLCPLLLNLHKVKLFFF